MMDFRISGLSPEPFAHLVGLDDDALAAYGAKRYVVDAKPGFPDRIALRDLEVGESAILVNYVHLDVASPYRASHAIFVAENASARYDRMNQIPDVLRTRLLSLRAFDADDMLVDADVVEGAAIEPIVERMFANVDVAFIHAHNAKQGCYAARIDRPDGRRN